VFVATIIGVLVSFIPWPDIVASLSGEPMWDRAVYIAKIQSANTGVDYINYGNFISLFTHEVLWAKLLEFASQSSWLHYSTLFQVISALSLSAFFALLAQRRHFLLLPLLINPLVIDLVFSQLRLALALSILIWLIILRVRAWYIVWPTAVVTIMIHTAMVIFVAAHICASVTKKDGPFRNWNDARRVTLLLLFGISVGVAIGPLREVLLSLIGDRREVYPHMSSSYLYLSYWLILFGALVIDYRRTIKKYESRYALAILGIIAVSTFTGGYTTRLIGAAFPFMVAGIFNVFGRHNFFISIPFLIYFVLQWLYYINNMVS